MTFDDLLGQDLHWCLTRQVKRYVGTWMPGLERDCQRCRESWAKTQPKKKR
jgi:hypothetical protein